MRILLTTLVVTMFLIPVGLSHEGPGGCDADDVTADPILRDWTRHYDPLLNDLLPGNDLVVAEDWSRLPTIPTLFVDTPTGLCDLTNLDEVLGSNGRELKTESDFESAAWLLARATDTEKLGLQVLDHFESFEWLTDGAAVTLVAKSPATGAIVRWDVTLDHLGQGEATWTVIAHEKGLRTEIEGWYLNIGETGPQTEEAVVMVSELFPTYDGKHVRINYDPAIYGGNATAEAEDVARNGIGTVRGYDTIKRDWGYPSADPDGFIDVTLNGCACIRSGNQVDIRLPHHMQQWIFDLIGAWYPDEDGVVEDVVGHELFHHFQYSIMQWNQPSWVIEGTARFAETALTPEFCHVPDSLQFMSNLNGFGYMMLNPNQPPTGNSYSFGLAWGHIYDTNGGTEIIKRVLEESAVNSAFPGFIDRALDSMPGDHDTFADAMADLGPRMVTRDFEWERWDGTASYNWGNEWLADLRVTDIRTNGQNLPVGRVSAVIPEYAFVFYDLDWEDLDESGAAVVTDGADTNRFAFVGTDGNGDHQIRPFEGAGAETELSDLILMGTRVGSAGGTTQITVAQL